MIVPPFLLIPFKSFVFNYFTLSYLILLLRTIDKFKLDPAVHFQYLVDFPFALLIVSCFKVVLPSQHIFSHSFLMSLCILTFGSRPLLSSSLE